MKIPFDTEGTTGSCPLADAGQATYQECRYCRYFIEQDGFDIICNYEEPEQEE